MIPYLICTALLLAVPGEAKKGDYPHPELLAYVSTLAKEIPARTVHVLDVRTRAKYDAGHIPTASWVDVAGWSKEFGDKPDKDAWTKRLGELGLEPTDHVVVYGDDLREAARVWWILRYWGFTKCSLFDGGWHAWDEDDGAVSREQPKVKPTTPKLTVHSDRLATKEQVLGFVKDKDHQLIDARSGKEFCGDDKRAKRGGAIPAAKHLEWSDLLDKEGRFKSADDLAKLLKEHEISVKEPAVTYCQSGGRASVMAFALELMGAKDVRNYYRSWSEWGNDPDTPIVAPKK